MDKKIIAVIVVIIVVAVVAALFLNFNVSKEDAKMKMVSKSSINEDSSIKIKLTDLNGTPIENQTVHLKIINKKGKIDEYSVKTNEKGIAQLKLNKIKPGTYTVNFTYDGNDTYNLCNLSKKVKIKEKVIEQTPEESSNTESYSSNDGGESNYNHPPRDGVDYDSSKMSYDEYVSQIKNNPNGHYDMAGNYYAPGEGQ